MTHPKVHMNYDYEMRGLAITQWGEIISVAALILFSCTFVFMRYFLKFLTATELNEKSREKAGG